MFDAIKLFYSCVGVIFVIYLLGYSTFLMLSVIYGSLDLYKENKKKKYLLSFKKNLERHWN